MRVKLLRCVVAPNGFTISNFFEVIVRFFAVVALFTVPLNVRVYALPVISVSLANIMLGKVVLAEREGEELRVKFEELIVPASVTFAEPLMSSVPVPLAPMLNTSEASLPKLMVLGENARFVKVVVCAPVPSLKYNFEEIPPSIVPRVRSALEVNIPPFPNVTFLRLALPLIVKVSVPIVISPLGEVTVLRTVVPANSTFAPSSITKSPSRVIGVAAEAIG